MDARNYIIAYYELCKYFFLAIVTGAFKKIE